ncbi:MAG: hypothetical protein ABEI06_10235 [Halobacteriaceae archaeon]
MDTAARARQSAREAISDITPSQVREVIEDRIASGSMIPGVLTLTSAQVAHVDRHDNRQLSDLELDLQEVEQRAAGVQLIYEGLRLTRSLVEENPWQDIEPLETDQQADTDVLAADIMVARGFYLLAQTDAADKAVATVQEFGRVETDKENDRLSDGNSLEVNVFELAVIAGSSIKGEDPPTALREYAIGLARTYNEPPLPSVEEGLPDRIVEVMYRVSRPVSDEKPQPQSATDP